jgi:hypothetical protein
VPRVEDRGIRMKDSEGNILTPGDVLYAKDDIGKEVLCYTIFKERGQSIALFRTRFGTTDRYKQSEITDSYWVVDEEIRTKITIHQRRIEAIG